MNEYASGYATKTKFCLQKNCNIHKCVDNTCTMYSKEHDGCKFSVINKIIENAFKDAFHMTCDESRRVARTLLLNSYRPEQNPNNPNNKRRN